jgi:hypothetical protein
LTAKIEGLLKEGKELFNFKQGRSFIYRLRKYSDGQKRKGKNQQEN